MINKPKLKMMTDMTKTAMYQHVWLRIVVSWNYIKRFILDVFEKIYIKIRDVYDG